jgi:protein-disulfide isomerase
MKRYVPWIVVAVLSALVSPPPGIAQTSDEVKALRKDVETLRDGQAAIQRDLQEIKRLLQTRPPAAAAAAPPQEVVLNLDGAPVKGAKSAKVTLVEFTDYQ